MHLLFLFPLIIAILAGYICLNSAEEMADLTGSVAIVSIILILVLAPWQLQLLVLGFVTISTRRLLLQNESRMKLDNNQQEQLNQRDVNKVR